MFKLIQLIPPHFILDVDGKVFKGSFYRGKDFVDLHLSEGTFRIPLGEKKNRRSSNHSAEGELTSPMPGKVIKVLVKENQKVKKGEVLLILEAMKMEHKVVSPKDGVVHKIIFKENDRVSQGEELIEIN